MSLGRLYREEIFPFHLYCQNYWYKVLDKIILDLNTSVKSVMMSPVIPEIDNLYLRSIDVYQFHQFFSRANILLHLFFCFLFR